MSAARLFVVDGHCRTCRHWQEDGDENGWCPVLDMTTQAGAQCAWHYEPQWPEPDPDPDP